MYGLALQVLFTHLNKNKRSLFYFYFLHSVSGDDVVVDLLMPQKMSGCCGISPFSFVFLSFVFCVSVNGRE